MIQHFDFLYWNYISQIDKKNLNYTEFFIYPDKIFNTLVINNIISVINGRAKNRINGFLI